MKSDPLTIEALEGLLELGYVEKLPPRPGETEPRWRLTELGKSQPIPMKEKTMVEDPHPILRSMAQTVENAIEEALDEGARPDDVIIYITCILTAAVLRRNVSTSVLAEMYQDAADAIEEGFELAPKAYREN